MAGNKIGYIEIDDESIETKISNSVSISEQEVHISFMRDESFAIIYTSDSTYITKLDKLCKESPKMYSVLENNGRSKTYRLEDKGLLTLRKKKRELTEEQRRAAGERMKQYHLSKSSEDDT